MHTFDSDGKPLIMMFVKYTVILLGKMGGFLTHIMMHSYYLRNGVPQSALELHSVCCRKQNSEIYILFPHTMK